MILIKKGDLVISGINVEKGAVAVYEGNEDLLATIHYSSYEFDKDKIDIDFFKYFLKSPVFREIINSQIRGGIKTELKPNKFLPLKINLPDKTKQIRIKNQLNDVSSNISKIKNITKENEILIDQFRDVVLLDAVQGKLNTQNPNDSPASELIDNIRREKEKLIKEKKIRKEKSLKPISKEEMQYDIPTSWQFVRFQDICHLITDGTHLTPRYTEKGRPFLSAQNVKPFKFMPEKHRYVSEEDFQNYIKNRKPELNDILLTRVGAGIGEAAVIDKPIDFAIYVSIALIKTFNKWINPNYLVVWLNSPIGREKSKTNTYGRGHSQGNLNLSLIRNFVIPIPPLSEQNRIVKKVYNLFPICEQLKQQITKNYENSEYLIQEALKELLKK